MKRYIIEAEWTVPISTTVEIEAESEEQAIARAKQVSEEMGCFFDLQTTWWDASSDTDFHLAECQDTRPSWSWDEVEEYFEKGDEQCA